MKTPIKDSSEAYFKFDPNDDSFTTCVNDDGSSYHCKIIHFNNVEVIIRAGDGCLSLPTKYMDSKSYVFYEIKILDKVDKTPIQHFNNILRLMDNDDINVIIGSHVKHFLNNKSNNLIKNFNNIDEKEKKIFLEKLEELNFPNIENITKRINKKEYSKLDNQIFQMLNSVIN